MKKQRDNWRGGMKDWTCYGAKISFSHSNKADLVHRTDMIEKGEKDTVDDTVGYGMYNQSLWWDGSGP